jgi:hypothetical protein
MGGKTAIINFYTREKKLFALGVGQNIAKISDIADESEIADISSLIRVSVNSLILAGVAKTSGFV